MQAKLESLQELNATVLAIDPHDRFSSQFLLKEAGLSTADLKIPLLLDTGLTASAAYGVLFQMRIHTEWSNRPATFIVDRDGVIRFIQRAKTFNDRPSVGQIIEQLKQLD